MFLSFTHVQVSKMTMSHGWTFTKLLYWIMELKCISIFLVLTFNSSLGISYMRTLFGDGEISKVQHYKYVSNNPPWAHFSFAILSLLFKESSNWTRHLSSSTEDLMKLFLAERDLIARLKSYILFSDVKNYLSDVDYLYYKQLFLDLEPIL